jgi:hypothetical protein
MTMEYVRVRLKTILSAPSNAGEFFLINMSNKFNIKGNVNVPGHCTENYSFPLFSIRAFVFQKEKKRSAWKATRLLYANENLTIRRWAQSRYLKLSCSRNSTSSSFSLSTWAELVMAQKVYIILRLLNTNGAKYTLDFQFQPFFNN